MSAAARIPLDEIRAARERLHDHVIETPTLRVAALDAGVGAAVSVKLEMLQHAGSFKARGAVNQLLALGRAAEKGVVGVSGGNFARALAWSADRLGLDATVVMPASAPASSIEATEADGSTVILVDDISAAFAEYDRRVAAGAAPTHPFDNLAMMTGNGTLGLELLEQAPDLTDVVVAVGGGGLLAGVLSAVKGLDSSIRVWAVESEGADSLDRSLASGEQTRIVPTSLIATLSAPYTTQRLLDMSGDLAGTIVVPDAEAIDATVELLDRHHLATEPAAATTLVAARRLGDRLGPGAHVGLVLCGANMTVAEITALRAKAQS